MQPSSASISRRERQQTSLPWNPDMEEASETPSYILFIDNGFPLRPRRRRRLTAYDLGDNCAGASRIDKSAVAQ